MKGIIKIIREYLKLVPNINIQFYLHINNKYSLQQLIKNVYV